MTWLVVTDQPFYPQVEAHGHLEEALQAFVVTRDEQLRLGLASTVYICQVVNRYTVEESE